MPREDTREYFKLLPANDYEYDWRLALNFFRGLPRVTRRLLFGWAAPPPLRFLAHVSRGRVTLYIGATPDYAGAVRAAFAGAYPKVSLVPCGSPAAGWDKGVVTEFYARGGRYLPFRRLEGPPSVLSAVLTALGAGRDTGVEALLDVCFRPFPSDEARRHAEAEAAKVAGLQAGGLWGEVVDALFSPALGGRGDRRDTAVKKYKQIRALEPSRLALAEEMRARFLPQEPPFEATVRVVARGPTEKAGVRCVLDAAAAVGAMAHYNRLEKSGSHGLGDRVKVGAMGETLLLNGSELANLVVVPGPDSPVWPYMERDVARTVAPPTWLLDSGAIRDENV